MYHNTNGARAIIQHLLSRDNMLNNAVFPEKIRALDNYTIGVEMLKGQVKVKDYNEKTMNFELKWSIRGKIFIKEFEFLSLKKYHVYGNFEQYL